MTFKQLLIEELENKKVYQFNWDSSCDNCRSEIMEGDDFVFMGSKRKICQGCLDNICEALEDSNL